MSELSLSVATKTIENNFSVKGRGERETRLMLEFWRSEVATLSVCQGEGQGALGNSLHFWKTEFHECFWVKHCDLARAQLQYFLVKFVVV